MSTLDQLRNVLAAPRRRGSVLASALAWSAVLLLRALAAVILLSPLVLLAVLLLR